MDLCFLKYTMCLYKQNCTILITQLYVALLIWGLSGTPTLLLVHLVNLLYFLLLVSFCSYRSLVCHTIQFYTFFSIILSIIHTDTEFQWVCCGHTPDFVCWLLILSFDKIAQKQFWWCQCIEVICEFWIITETYIFI